MLLPGISTFSLLRGMLFVLLLLLSACGDDRATLSPDDAVIENGVYHNRYFGFTVALPADWVVASERANAAMMKRGTESVSGEDDSKREQIEAAVRNAYNLVTVSRFPASTRGKTNPTLAAIAERIPHSESIETGQDYLKLLDATLTGGPLEYRALEEDVVKLGARVFYWREYRLALPTGEVEQRFYARVEGEFVLLFVTSTRQDSGRDVLDAMLGSVRWPNG